MLSMGLGSQMGTWVAWEGDADAMSGGGGGERERERDGVGGGGQSRGGGLRETRMSWRGS